jgi:hypothetical protein
MKDHRRKRDRLRTKQGRKPAKEDADPAAKEQKLLRQARELKLVPINRERLHSRSVFGSFEQPTFAGRFYLDWKFACKDCGKVEIWTGRQQKWWYEVARGEVEQVAVRCRGCRQRENKRRVEARRVHLEGLNKKRRKDERKA